MKTLLLSTLLLPFLAALAPAETPATAKPAAPAAAPAAAAVKHVAAPEAAKLLADAAKSPAQPIAVIDVRTPEEFAESHLKGAQNVDIASPDFAKNLAMHALTRARCEPSLARIQTDRLVRHRIRLNDEWLRTLA